MMGAVWRLAQNLATDKVQILEIGSWCGASALAWGEAIQLYFGGNGKISCVDAWQPYVDLEVDADDNNRRMDAALRNDEPFDIFRQNIQFLPATVEIEILRGWSQDILPALPDAHYDLVYIDGDHTYAGVLSDINNSTGLLRDGGILCGDDLEMQAHQCDLSVLDAQPNVDRYYDQHLDAHYHPGVTKAVAETFGAVSAWSGFWAMEKSGQGWDRVSLKGMPPRIPGHIPAQSLLGLKALLMENDML
ncbi:MAG: class I SAM-dependent methyltransferase [Rhodospirillales bacterium]|nr:class I SAM-dependent methyltransferase [Rhodospirillales bacterium]MDP6645006.1 class I SAM-dependent methyltransferase [Rhodospirillales bacterium]